MAGMNEDKLKAMEAEMDRFEAEIALPTPLTSYPPPPPPGPGPRVPIMANTYNQVQKQLEERQQGFVSSILYQPAVAAIAAAAFNTNPAAAAAAGLFVPSQVQRNPIKPENPVVISATPKVYSSKQIGKKLPPPPMPEPPPPPKRPAMITIAGMLPSVLSATGEQRKPPEIPRPPPPPMASSSSSSMSNDDSKKGKKLKKLVRTAGGQVWEDTSLADWDQDDFRIFCGDLGNDVTDEVLSRAFSKFPSFMRAKVVRDKRNNKTKGYGFVSFKDPQDFIRAMKEMNGRYVGSRPIKLRKSTWKHRNMDVVRKKEREKQALLSLVNGR